MKIRLLQEGFEHYTGQMGVLMFENGLSTTDVLQHDAVRMSAVMKCELEDGSNPHPAQGFLDGAHTPAPHFSEPGNGPEKDAAGEGAQNAAPEGQKDAPAAPKYTQEQLAAIADEKGIKGLREIADPMGIKGTSIKELIAEILAGHSLNKSDRK